MTAVQIKAKAVLENALHDNVNLFGCSQHEPGTRELGSNYPSVFSGGVTLALVLSSGA